MSLLKFKSFSAKKRKIYIKSCKICSGIAGHTVQAFLHKMTKKEKWGGW